MQRTRYTYTCTNTYTSDVVVLPTVRGASSAYFSPPSYHCVDFPWLGLSTLIALTKRVTRIRYLYHSHRRELSYASPGRSSFPYKQPNHIQTHTVYIYFTGSSYACPKTRSKNHTYVSSNKINIRKKNNCNVLT